MLSLLSCAYPEGRYRRLVCVFPEVAAAPTQAAEDTAAQQAEQEAAAAEAKAAEQAAAAAARAAELERARKDAIETYKAEQEAKRQAEADKIVQLC